MREYVEGKISQSISMFAQASLFRAVARTLIGGGGYIFMYSGFARLTSFEINFISKETSPAELEYMNIQPPPQLTL